MPSSVQSDAFPVVVALYSRGKLDTQAHEADLMNPIDTIDIVWPTSFRIITQRWMARPEYYAKFGLLGHEGVDIRAPVGSNIYAVMEGEIIEAGWRRLGHPYGNAIRIRHVLWGAEYTTIYAHLQEGSLKVNVGDSVIAGVVIGLADSTGNVSGAHLHFGLIRKGASLAKETPQKYDLIDPPLLLDLARTAR